MSTSPPSDTSNSAALANAISKPAQLSFLLTSANTTEIFSMDGYSAAFIVVDNYGVSSGGTLTITGSDGINLFTPINTTDVQGVPSSRAGVIRLSNTTANTIYTPKQSQLVKLTLSDTGATIYPTSVMVYLSNTPISFPPSIEPKFFPSALWNFVVPTGAPITAGTTTLQIGWAAASPAYRLAVTKIHLLNTGSAGTEFTLQDTSGTPVILWRGYIAAAGTVGCYQDISLAEPKYGLAGKSINLVLVSTTNVSLYANISGFATGAV